MGIPFTSMQNSTKTARAHAMRKEYLVTLIALIITGSLVYAYQITFKHRWPGKHAMDIHALWGTSVLGKTGLFNDKATLNLTHPTDRLRVWDKNGYQLKVYEPNYIIHGNKRAINKNTTFEVQNNGQLKEIRHKG